MIFAWISETKMKSGIIEVKYLFYILIIFTFNISCLFLFNIFRILEIKSGETESDCIWQILSSDLFYFSISQQFSVQNHWKPKVTNILKLRKDATFSSSSRHVTGETCEPNYMFSNVHNSSDQNSSLGEVKVSDAFNGTLTA